MNRKRLQAQYHKTFHRITCWTFTWSNNSNKEKTWKLHALHVKVKVPIYSGNGIINTSPTVRSKLLHWKCALLTVSVLVIVVQGVITGFLLFCLERVSCFKPGMLHVLSIITDPPHTGRELKPRTAGAILQTRTRQNQRGTRGSTQKSHGHDLTQDFKSILVLLWTVHAGCTGRLVP